MLKSDYIEDIFLEFYISAMSYGINLQHQDQSAANSFYHVLQADKELTQNQANYLLKILQKYKNSLLPYGIDFSNQLSSPKWKKPFRVLDFSKKIFVEKSELGIVNVCVKFPYQLKKEFETEFETGVTDFSSWDNELKLRKIPIYNCNLIQMYDFVTKHNFEVDETFMIALGEVEEIWQNQEQLMPKAIIVGDTLKLINASVDAIEYFQKNKTDNFYDDSLLAKSMGYCLDSNDDKKFIPSWYTIVSSTKNNFWIKSVDDLLNLSDNLSGKICIILDRVADCQSWLENFARALDDRAIPRSQTKVCFRMSKDQDHGFNSWIKENGFGGPVDSGKYFIFLHKPAKWLFKEIENVKILVSNNIYPATNSGINAWFNSHPCVIYVGDIKPAEQRGRKIVEL